MFLTYLLPWRQNWRACLRFRHSGCLGVDCVELAPEPVCFGDPCEFLWTPSLRDGAGSPEHSAPGAFADEPNDEATRHYDGADRSCSGPAWRCVACDSTNWEPLFGGWGCVRCGSRDFYDPMAPLRSVTATGTWMYMPRSSHDHVLNSPPSSRSSQTSRKRRRRKNPGPPTDGAASEFPESEPMTHDPCVEPNEVSGDLPPRPNQCVQSEHQGRPVQRRGPDHLGHSGPRQGPGRSPQNSLGPYVPSNAKDKSSVDDADWNSRKGPEPGVRWRTGQAPAPPIWKYESNDLRAYSKYCKKVKIWEIQMQPYASKKDQVLLLYNSLTGDAEQELEHLSIDEVHKDNGVDLILERLKTPFEQRSVFQKRKFVYEYENLRRYPGEMIRTYISRLRRAIRNLKAVGVDVTACYDGEALGSRLLDRSGLTVESQRLVLIGTNQKLELETIAEALTLQYPDFRGPPPVAGRDGRESRDGKGQGKQQRPASLASTSSARASAGKGSSASSSSRSSSSTSYRNVFAAEVDTLEAIQEDQDPNDPPLDQEPDPDDEQEQDDEEELIPDEDPQEDEIDLHELSQVLTVTARRLAGLTLGRKYSDKKPGSSSATTSAAIAKRKQSSHCSACGERGHWKDDDICPMKGKKTGHGKTHEQRPPFKPKTSSAAPGQKMQQAFPVVHHEYGHMEINDGEEFGNAFACNMVNNPSFHVHEVQAFSPTSFVGKMILDSACQRTCCGELWYREHSLHALQVYKLKCKQVPTLDIFQFGKGEATQALFRSYMPVGIGQQPFLMATAVISANVPLLGSNKLLERLRAVIDMGKGMVHFSALGVTVPLIQMGGHFTVDLLDFPTDEPSKLSCWKDFTKLVDWKQPDPELILPPAKHINNDDSDTAAPVQAEEPVSTSIRTHVPHAPAAADMVGELVHPCGKPSCRASPSPM